MTSEQYRYYRLDGVGRLYDAEWLAADSDEAAMTDIKERHPDAHFEVWQGPRFVASVSPDRQSA